MKKLSEFSDREIALMLGGIHENRVIGRAEALVVEAAYRLVRSGKGPLTRAEEAAVEEVHNADFLLRSAERKQRQLNSRKKQPEAAAVHTSKRRKVVAINAV